MEDDFWLLSPDFQDSSSAPVFLEAKREGSENRKKKTVELL